MYVVAPPVFAQRIMRAKARNCDARVPCEVPLQAELPARLDSVLRVIYLVFNEGYSASAGDSLTRTELSGEAIRLGRLLAQLLPEPESIGLLALMLLQESRCRRRDDWAEIVGLYDVLLRLDPSPVVELNRARRRWRCMTGQQPGWQRSMRSLRAASLPTTRRLLPHRGPGPERGDPDGIPHSGGEVRLRRSASGR